ncbi:hypothetical protein DV738_g2111, partial [Chaetothyriales sp. CBS 135597]
MEASHSLQRRLVMLSLGRSLHRCSPSSPLPSPSFLPRGAVAHLSCRRRPLPSSSRPFSSSQQWRQGEPPQPTPDAAVAPSRTAPSQRRPAAGGETTKQALQSYISAVNTIIDGFKLKESLSSRQHEQLVVALTNAETRLGARHAHPDSFLPLLDSLKGEINPILQRRFGTTDVQSLRTEAIVNIAQDLDAVFGLPPKRPSQEAAQSRESRDNVNKWAALLQNPLSGINADLSAGSAASVRSPLAGASLNDYLNRRTAAERRESLDLNARLTAAEANANAQFRANYPSLNTNLSLSGQARDSGLRLKPSLGRTVEASVGQGGDLTRIFRSLEALCKRNNVSYDFNKQRFHVRRGQRRKDVRSQRWRKQFSAGFLEECRRIRRMRAQGW